MGPAHPLRQFIDARQPIVVQHDLHRTTTDERVIRDRDVDGTHEVEALHDPTIGNGTGKTRHGRCRCARGGIGEAGHAPHRQSTADIVQIGEIVATGKILGQPGVHPKQSPRGMAGGIPLNARILDGVEAQCFHAGRAHDPHHPRSVLDPHPGAGRHSIKDVPVEVTGHGLVIADSAPPSPPVGPGGAQCRRHSQSIDDVNGADGDRSASRHQRPQMKMVVMEPG